jgi:hypothetical protein
MEPSSAVGAAALAIVIVAIAFLSYRATATRRLFRTEVLSRLAREEGSTRILTEEDIRTLPEPVRQYIRYAGLIGKETVHNMRAVWQGKMRRDPRQGWFGIKADQYNFYGDLARIFFIRGRIFGVPVVGRDLYSTGEGRMTMKAAGLIPVVDATGTEMASSGLVTLFNDMCLLAPATLIDGRIRWVPVDSLTAKGSIEDAGHSVSATLHFNQAGELTDFVTDDRYMESSGRFRKIRWSTPVSQYMDFHGVRLASHGAGVWHLDEGEFMYAEFDLQSIDYNTATYH